MQKAVQLSKQEPSKPKPSFTVVGFRYDQARSVGYKHIDNEPDVAKEVFALLKIENADVISVRRVYPKQPIEPEGRCYL